MMRSLGLALPALKWHSLDSSWDYIKVFKGDFAKIRVSNRARMQRFINVNPIGSWKLVIKIRVFRSMKKLWTSSSDKKQASWTTPFIEIIERMIVFQNFSNPIRNSTFVSGQVETDWGRRQTQKSLEMNVDIREGLPWHLEWVWVSGYSTLATLVIVFNLALLVSIGKNRYLHFSFHYAVIAMALRWGK